MSSPLRGECRERAILGAAIELVAEIGYERVTTDAIARRASASKATIYRKWPGKAELVAEALRRHAHSGVACVADTGSARGDLLAAMEGMCRTIVGDGGPSFLGLLEAIREDPGLRDLIRGQMRAQSQVTGSAITDRARARGETLTSRPEFVLELAVAHLLLSTLLSGEAPGAAAREAFADSVALPLLTRESE